MPEFPDRSLIFERDVLRKAQKIDCRAKFVDLDSTERSKPPKPPQQGDQQPRQSGQKEPSGQGQGGRSGKLPEVAVTHAMYPQSGSYMVIDPYYPSYQPRPHIERPYQEDYVYYFHFLLLALFVSMLILR